MAKCKEIEHFLLFLDIVTKIWRYKQLDGKKKKK